MLMRLEQSLNLSMTNIPTINDKQAVTKWQKFCTVFEYVMEWLALITVISIVLLGGGFIK